MVKKKMKIQGKIFPILLRDWDVIVDSMYRDVSMAIGAKMGIR